MIVGMSVRRLVARWWFWVLLVVLFLSLRTNAFRVADHGAYKGFQEDSDALVASALEASTLGTRTSVFLRFPPDPGDPSRYDPYFAQAGFASALLAPIWHFAAWLFEGSPGRFRLAGKVLRTVTSMANALVLALLLSWFLSEFRSRAFALLFLGPSLAGSGWVVLFGKSVYWQMWSWYAPFVLGLWFSRGMFESGGGRPGARDRPVLALAAFLLVLVKCLMGYEYVSAVLVASVLPFAYHLFGGAGVRAVGPGACVALGGLAGFLCALGVHLVLLASEVDDPTGVLRAVVMRRTGLFGISEDVGPVLREGLEADLSRMIGGYLFGGRGLKEGWLLLLSFLAALLSWGAGLFRRDRRLLALLAVSAVSLAGPFSWFVLAKGHSHHHFHMNYVLWHLPSNFLIYAFLARAACLLPGAAAPPVPAFRGGGAAWLMKTTRFFSRK